MKQCIYKYQLKFKGLVLLLLALSFGHFGLAQNTDTLFKTANEFYQKGDYNAALKSYQQIEKQQLESADLYYNLGNTYYKLNQIAPTIYNYEKALLLDPNNDDIKNNLTIAQRMTIDKIDVLPKTFLQKLEATYIRSVKFETWAYIAICASILFVLLFLAYYFSYHTGKKRLYFILAMASFITVVLGFSFAYSGFQYTKNHQPAIVFSAKASVKNAPTLNSNEVFELHEGTKVIILEQVEDWLKIKLADGKIGWLSETDLKAL